MVFKFPAHLGSFTLATVLGIALICSCDALGSGALIRSDLASDIDLDKEGASEEKRSFHVSSHGVVIHDDKSVHGKSVYSQPPHVVRHSLANKDLPVTRAGHKSAYKQRRTEKSYWVPSFRAALLGQSAKDDPLPCGIAFGIPGVSDDAQCPEHCPFLAEDAGNHTMPCRFQCVQEGRCAAVNPEATIPDKDDMICRGCQVEACIECLHHGEDVCATCAPRYKLLEDGTCESEGFAIWITFLVVLCLSIALVLAYCGQLCCRANINKAAVTRGIRDRWRSRNRPNEPQVAAGREITQHLMPGEASEDPRAKCHPITTNLCRTPVCGPGLLLYFNFQAMIIIWMLLVIIAWAVTASYSNWDLFTLGIKDADTPREVCANVRWGHNTQAKFMYSKVLFMGGVYVVSFLMLIIHATLQFRRYQDVDDSTTMKDYCAYLVGLPIFHGAEKAEDRVKQVIEAATGEKVVGVSVCWNFLASKDKVHKTIEYDMHLMDTEILAGYAGRVEAAAAAPDPDLMARVVRKVDNGIISVFYGWEQDHDPNVDEEALLKGIDSYNKAFVVFGTEASRDAAVATVKRMPNGVQFEGSLGAKLHKQEHEPEGVQWDRFGYHRGEFMLRLFGGLCIVLLGLCVWAVLVFVPMAYYFTSYPYSNGDEPGVMVQVAFTFFITAGNEMLNLLTGKVVDWIGFRYRDGINVAYLLIYTCSCFFCVLLDLIIACWMVHMQLVQGEAFTSNGVRIINLDTWKSIFESFPMQKMLGWELFLFAFPATMLAPFVLEPFAKVWLPYFTGWALVKSRPDLDATMSEKCLGFVMDIEPHARYADLILNVILAVLMLFFPSGYTLLIFGVVFASHIYIYMLDHWVTLRASRNNHFSSQAMDVSASAFMSVPLGLLLVCIIFKFHCIPDVLPLRAELLAAYCVLAFSVHVTTHVFIICKLVPKLGKRGHIRSSLTYPEAAKKYACNWFTSNPMHCLRSKYFYKHSPPCQFFVEGKENLIRSNHDLGLYYQEKDDDWMPPSSDEEETAPKKIDDAVPNKDDGWNDDNDLAPIVDDPFDSGAQSSTFPNAGDEDIAP